MGRLGFVLCLAFVVPSWTQTRTWAFAQDTVHEWLWDSLSGWYGRDTLRIENNSADTLRFDSSQATIVSPPGVFFEGLIEAAPRITGGGGVIAYAPPQIGYVYEFTILQDDFFFPPQSTGDIFRISLDAAKINDTETVRDSLVFQLVLFSGRTADTVYIKGGACCVTPVLRLGRPPPTPAAIKPYFDLRGRRVERALQAFYLKEP